MISARGLPLATDLGDAGQGVAEIIGSEVRERVIEACGARDGTAQR